MTKNIWIIFGVVLLAFGVLYPMVTLVMDDTPPELAPQFPIDGQTCTSCGYFSCVAQDLESGIKTVTGRLDTTDYTLSLWTGDVKSGIWRALVDPVLYSGTHTLLVTAVNEVDLTASYTISFTVYAGLQGQWFINHIEITDPSQVVKLTTLTLSFKFGRTAGIEPLTCTVSWSGPETGNMALVESSADTWTGSHTFTAGGTYDMTLTADDGTEIITMNIFGIQVGGPSVTPPLTWLTTRNMLLIFGGVLIAVGLIRRKKTV